MRQAWPGLVLLASRLFISIGCHSLVCCLLRLGCNSSEKGQDFCMLFSFHRVHRQSLLLPHLLPAMVLQEGHDAEGGRGAGPVHAQAGHGGEGEDSTSFQRIKC